jgi:hypothetical protein
MSDYRKNARKRSRQRGSFMPGLKAEIVEPCQRDGRSVGQIAKDLYLN